MENNIRKGRCRNYGDCDRAGEEISIEDGKPFECPECHQPLMPLDGPKGKNNRKSSKAPLLIGGAIAAVGIVAVLFFVCLGKDEDTLDKLPSVPTEEKTDTIPVTKETASNRNDTLVIKMEGVEKPEEEVINEVITNEKEEPQPSEAAPVVKEKPIHVEKPSHSSQNPSKKTISSSHSLSYGSWTGGWKNGQPHGTGTMTYSTSRVIDSRDSKGRVAQPGEYIVGEWDNGHLVQGRWFKKDGSKEAIIIGKVG